MPKSHANIHVPDTCGHCSSIKTKITTTVKNKSFNLVTDDLKTNLYVYNESSYPAKIRKQIRAKVTHSPEVVAIILPESDMSCATKSMKFEPLRALLDSGGSANLVRSAAVKNLKKSKSKIPIHWNTANGKFLTDQTVNATFQLPEFTEDVTFNQPFHVCPHDLDYDLIIGRETLIALGIGIDFLERQITWNDVRVEMKDPTLFDNRKNLLSLAMQVDPRKCKESLDRALHILNAGREENPDLARAVHDCKHLDQSQRSKLLTVLQRYDDLFDGKLGLWKTEPASIELKPGSKPYHGRAYPVPHIQKALFKKELDALVNLDVLEKDSSSEWAAPSFTQPKKNPNELRFLSDFRQLNKCIIRKPYPLPKISEILKELTGLSYATALDLKMGYYTIRLNPDAQRICTIITPWGKYKYKRLPMGIMTAPDIFQNKMSDLMSHLEFVRVYLDDLLIITDGSFDDHLARLEEALLLLQDSGLKCNLTKSFFCQEQVEYLGYLLTREGIKPLPSKVKAILDLEPPKNVRGVRRVLGIIQYYRDLWDKRSHVLAPLTSLVGECGQPKNSKRKAKKFVWLPKHQEAFNEMKRIVSRAVTLAYPDFNKPFVINTDASDYQLGAVITQDGKPLAFYSRKLNSAQRNYTVTEKELLSIVETLREFRGILLGHVIKIYTDHKNLEQINSTASSQRAMRWRILMEEFGPKLVYIKGTKNTITNLE